MAKQMTVETEFSPETASRIKNKISPEVAEEIASYQKEIIRLKTLVRSLLSRESLIIAETFKTNDEEQLAQRVQKIILSFETGSTDTAKI